MRITIDNVHLLRQTGRHYPQRRDTRVITTRLDAGEPSLVPATKFTEFILIAYQASIFHKNIYGHIIDFFHDLFIPMLTDQNPCAQSRNPMDMMRQGWASSLFQASQQ